MAIIYKTTMSPTKLELLTAWLPAQPWYAGGVPELSKVGGFRLDDPDGEVGIEFMVVTDAGGERPVTYHVPLAYRGAPLDGAAEQAFIGTSEHGVLGRRWVYDGAYDPVVVGRLLALLQGAAEPQMQSEGDTPDPSVTSHFNGGERLVLVAVGAVTSERHGTDIIVETDPAGRAKIGLIRVLREGATAGAQAHVEAPWTSADGGRPRAPFAVLYA